FRHHQSLNGQTALVIQANEGWSKAQVSIWSRDGSPFRMSRATSTIAEISVEPASEKPDKLQRLLVSFANLPPSQEKNVKKAYIDIVADKYSKEPFRVEVLVLP